jgi:hypothetical protein
VRRLPGLLLVAVLAWAAAACGGSTGATGDTGGPAAVVQTVGQATTGPAPPAGSLQALLGQKPGDDVALVFGSSDFAVGDNRVTFLVLRPDGALVDATRARVLVARGGLDARPTLEAQAENLPVGATAKLGGADDFDAPAVWVVHLKLDQPGQYSLLVDPEGVDLQAVGQIEVGAKTAVPAVGSKAPASDNPTLADGFPDDITTARPPDTELLRYSVAQSLADHVPFVVVFATPKYCQSRVCGPVVDVVDKVRRRFEGTGIRFIHIEIYKNNDPSQGFNRWVGEWNLPTEPYTFLVDSAGTVRASFEGLVTLGELEQAVRDTLE